jgi:septal ring factor EnvC (AmiA/AmiB activator)
MNQILTNLDRIVELSASMLAVAREGDWEQVQELEQQRQSLLDQTFPLDKDSISDADALTKQIQKISDIDKETMALMVKGRKEFSRLANKISSGRQAVNSYRDIAGR